LSFRAAICVVVLSGSNIAPGQGGFIAHLDIVQVGRNGFATSIREVPNGYLNFGLHLADPGIGPLHVFVRKLSSSGSVVSGIELDEGDTRNFDLGYIDGVSESGLGSTSAIVKRGWGPTGSTWLAEFDANGDTTSSHLIFGFSDADSITIAVRQLRRALDGYLICGWRERGGAPAKAFLSRLDPVGDTLWTKQFGFSNEQVVALGVCEGSDGSIYLTGYSLWQGVVNSSFLIRTDVQGNELWRRNYGNRANVNGAVRVAADGNILTWSEYREPQWPNWYWQQMMLTKWDPAGNIIWQMRSHYNDYVNTFDFEVLSDGSIIATGTSLLEAVLAKFSSTGDSLWSRSYTPTDGGCYLYDVQPTSDGGFVATGTAYWYDQPPEYQTNQLIWVLKTDSLGCVVPGCQNVGVQEYALELNEHLRVWPNPASDVVHLELTLPPGAVLHGAVRAVLLDMLGRQVSTWPVQRQGDVLTLSAPLSPGEGQGVRAGTYYLHLTDERRWLAGSTVVIE